MSGTSSGPRDPRVAIIGAGMSGICMAIKLKEAGIEDVTIFEKASAVGGTWRENSYPGLSCDVPSRNYSYSFAPNPDWSRMFPGGPELWRYFEDIVDRFGLRPHIRFDERVEAGRWADGRWHVRTSEREEAFDFLINGAGILHVWDWPDIPGLDTFAGPKWHSARWDHSVTLTDKRVGVIGTGSTGAQITGALAGTTRELKVFMRTPQWILWMPNLRVSRLSRSLFRRFPGLCRWSHRTWGKGIETILGVAPIRPGWQRTLLQAMARAHLRVAVRDRGLRRRLTPAHEPMCKRIIITSRFYPGMQDPRTTLVDAGIERIEPTGVRTSDGVLHEVDCLALATGFDGTAYGRPLALTGEDGVTLDEVWDGGPKAYRTIALPHFPNYFTLIGPHSPFGNSSVVAIAETQVQFVMAWIERFRRGEIASVAPTTAATDRFNAEMRAAMPDTVWVTGCNSWYLDESGLPTLWPWTPAEHRERLATAPESDFNVERTSSSTAAT